MLKDYEERTLVLLDEIDLLRVEVRHARDDSVGEEKVLLRRLGNSLDRAGKAIRWFTNRECEA